MNIEKAIMKTTTLATNADSFSIMSTLTISNLTFKKLMMASIKASIFKSFGKFYVALVTASN